MDKEKKKVIKRKLAWVSLRTFTFLNGILPLRLAYISGAFFGRLAFFLARRHRRIALESLATAFPELSRNKIKEIGRNSFVGMLQSSLEVFHVLRNYRDLDNIRIEGVSHLEAALKRGRGVVAVSAHLGNFPVMSLKLARQGYPVNVVARPMRDPQAGAYIQNLREATGVKTIFSYPRRECVNSIIKALRAGEIVIIQMDQNFGTGGVWVKFFGKLAATPVGPIVFAQRTSAAMVPVYIYREGLGKHCIRICPEYSLQEKETKEETVLVNAIGLTRIIQSWVSQFPEQWGWIHRRWKSRPSDKIKRMPFKMETD